MKNSNTEIEKIGVFAGVHGNLLSELEEKIRLYSRVSHYILITGERGTGKTTIARQIHEQSPRAKKEFVNLNCASLSDALLESELFGYEKGAFTGATAAKAGLFETASGGTLFLDEIGELSPNLQAKLLKAVEERKIRRVGSNFERAVDVRVIAATSQNLKKMTADGRFRPDLYDRLNVLNLETVPLRHQRGKIKDLVVRQLEHERLTIGRGEPFEISDGAMRQLQIHDWDGNFRELLNFTTRLAVECLDDGVVTSAKVKKVLLERTESPVLIKSDTTKQSARNVHPNSQKSALTITLDPLYDDLESIYLKAAEAMIQYHLRQNGNNLRKAATEMRTSHTTLARILKKHGERGREIRHFSQQPASFAAVA